MAEEAKWYVIHTYSGYENAVATAIKKVAENRRMTDLIHEVTIPMETVTEVTEKGSKDVERKVFPGYVLIKMVMTEDSWHLVRRVRGVTGFVGDVSNADNDKNSDKKLNILPLTEEELIAMGVKRREVKLGFNVGDTVLIIDGAFTNQKAHVDDIDIEAERVYATITMFGRETPIELDLNQVEPEKD